MSTTSHVAVYGACAFGLVIGWATSFAILKSPKFGFAQLSGLIATVGGGAVTAIFQAQDIFGAYAIGLAIAFFLHRFVSHQSVAKLIDDEINKA